MSAPHERYLAETIIEIPSDFEVDLNLVVMANCRLTLEGIDRARQEELELHSAELAGDAPEILSDALSNVAFEFEELRKAAIQLALVGVVTRLQHWVGLLVNKAKITVPKPERAKSKLICQLEALNKSLNCDSPLLDFENLVNLRDSIVHADSLAQWEYNGPRTVPEHFRDAYGKIRVTEEDLQKFVAKAILQISFYDEVLKQREAGSSA